MGPYCLKKRTHLAPGLGVIGDLEVPEEALLSVFPTVWAHTGLD